SYVAGVALSPSDVDRDRSRAGLARPMWRSWCSGGADITVYDPRCPRIGARRHTHQTPNAAQAGTALGELLSRVGGDAHHGIPAQLRGRVRAVRPPRGRRQHRCRSPGSATRGTKIPNPADRPAHDDNRPRMTLARGEPEAVQAARRARETAGDNAGTAPPVRL